MAYPRRSKTPPPGQVPVIRWGSQLHRRASLHETVYFDNAWTSVLRMLQEVISGRFRDSKMNVAEVSKDAIEFLVSDSYDPAFLLWNRLAQNSPTVSDEDMSILLGLSDGQIHPSSEKAQFYIRSYAMTHNMLAQLLYVAPTNPLLSRCEILLCGPHTTVYLRYIGITARSVEEREEEHIRSIDGLVGLMNRLGFQPSVFTLPSAACVAPSLRRADLSTPLPPHAQLREQIIIALFGLENLLNQQQGGFHNPILPSPTSIPKEKLFESYSASDSPYLDLVHARISCWGNSIREYFNGIHTIRLPGRFQIALANAIADQASPSFLINEHCPLAILGEKITVTEYKLGRKFLSREDPYISRAGKNLLDMFQFLVESSKDTLWSRPISRQPKFLPPFIDLSYNPWKISHQDIEFARQGLHILNPIIIVSASQSSTAAALGHFRNLEAVSVKNFIERFVGKCFLVSTDKVPESPSLDEAISFSPSHYSLLFPIIDPGYHKYGPRPPVLAELELTTLHYVFAVASLVPRLLDSPPALDLPDRNSRVAGLYRVLNGENSCLIPDSLADSICSSVMPLKMTLDLAKVSYLEYYSAHSSLRIQTVKQTMHREQYIGNAMERTRRSETALGDPGSEERRNQVAKLLLSDRSDLFMGELPKGDWINWAMDLKEGASYFISAMVRKGNQNHEKADLVRHRAGSSIVHLFRKYDDVPSTENIIGDRTEEDAHLVRRGKWMAQKGIEKLSDPREYGEIQRERVTRGKDIFRPRELGKVSGEDIQVLDNGNVKLRVQFPHGAEEICLRADKHLLDASRKRNCTVEVNLDGIFINVHGADSSMLLCSADNFWFHLKYEELFTIWARENKTTPPIFPVPRGNPPLLSMAKKSKLYSPGDVSNVDALWILMQWLDEEFPTGGSFVVREAILSFGNFLSNIETGWIDCWSVLIDGVKSSIPSVSSRFVRIFNCGVYTLRESWEPNDNKRTRFHGPRL